LFGHRSFLLARAAENGAALRGHRRHNDPQLLFTVAPTGAFKTFCPRSGFAALTPDKGAMLRAIDPALPSLSPATLNKPDGGKR